LEPPTFFEDINLHNSILEQRKKLQSLPQSVAFEIPGRPHVYYELFNHKLLYIQKARKQVGFLFKAFEKGHVNLFRKIKKTAVSEPRAVTIREFMNWTVGGNPELQHEAWLTYPQDFDGFTVICLRERFCPQWPVPKAHDIEFFSNDPRLGADKSPMPFLQTKDKPIVAATIRAGPGYIEVPFFATVNHRKAKGFGRCLKEAIENVAKGLDVDILMLSSESLDKTQTIWNKMGFIQTYMEDLDELDVGLDEMLHMANTVQMHKLLPSKSLWKTCIVKHKLLKYRMYYV